MKNILVMAAVALVAASTMSYVRAAAGDAQAAPTVQEPPASPAATGPVSSGLNDLNAMTFGCPKAALNAAAREAAKIPAQGTYQFAYFSIVNDSHHATYEVHFKSNYEGEKDVKYCVEMYCQQGWDPSTTKTSVMLMTDARPQAAGAGHAAACGRKPAPVKRPVAR